MYISSGQKYIYIHIYKDTSVARNKVFYAHFD